MNSGLYIYGIVPKGGGNLPRITGIDGSLVYSIEGGGLLAIVHDCLDPPNPMDEHHLSEMVLAHAAVVEVIWNWAGTVLPMRFGTVIRAVGDRAAEENIAFWLEGHEGHIARLIELLAGKVELGIQVTWEPSITARHIRETDEQVQRMMGCIEELSKGAAYLYRHKVDRVVQEEMARHKAVSCQRYLKVLMPYVSDFREIKPQPVQDGEMLMNLSVLARKEEVSQLGETLAGINGEEGIRVRFTGPWPPYSFVPDYSKTAGEGLVL